MPDDDHANALYVAAVQSGQRNLPEPYYWRSAMGANLRKSWTMFEVQFPEDACDNTPFNAYMRYMSKATRDGRIEDA